MMPSRHWCMAGECDWLHDVNIVIESSHHSYLIYYGHDTLQNCATRTNPYANTCKWHMACLILQYSIPYLKIYIYMLTGQSLSWNATREERVHQWRTRERASKMGWKKNSPRWNQITKSPPELERKQTDRGKRATEGIYSWLLLWAQWQNKLLWCLWCSVLTQNIYGCWNKDRKKQTEAED